MTLDGRDGSERLAAVLLLDPPATTSMATAPTIALEQTLVRGRGRAVHVASARPFDLTLRDCVTVLAAPVVSVEPTARAMPTPGTIAVRLDRVTALLGGPVIEFAGRSRGDFAATARFAPAPTTCSPPT